MKKTLLSLLIGIAIGAGAIFVAHKQGALMNTTAAPSGAHASNRSAIALPLKQAMAGEITQKSYFNYTDGSRTAIYQVPVEANQRYQILMAGPLNASISLFRNQFLLQNLTPNTRGRDSRGGRNCKSPAATSGPQPLYFTAEYTGPLEIAVNGANASSYGPYEITVAPESAEDRSANTTLTLEAPIQNTANGKKDNYAFTVTEAGLYVFDLESCSFDSLLQLSGNGIDASDDDGGEGLNARINTWLEPGEYTLVADTAERTEDDMLGPYTLTARKQSLPANTRLTPVGENLSIGTDYTILLDSGANHRPSFTFTLDQRSNVVIDARSDSVDTVLELEGNGQSWEDDDGGEGSNARIRETLAAGTYTVTVRAFGRSGGLATVSVRTSGAARPATGGAPSRPTPAARSAPVPAASPSNTQE